MGLFTSKEFDSLECLFDDQLKDLYDAEHRLTDAIPKMAEKASSSELKQAFEHHLQETKGHVDRLKEVFKIRGIDEERKACDAMKGIISEGEEVVNAKGDPDVIDAALIVAAQRVEHYEMAGYGCLRNLAQRLNLQTAVHLLQQTLDEEGAADQKLTSIAESSVNAKAAV